MTATAPPPPPPCPIPGLDFSDPADRRDWERFLLYLDERSTRKAARQAGCSRQSLQQSVKRVSWLLKRLPGDEFHTTGQARPS